MLLHMCPILRKLFELPPEPLKQHHSKACLCSTPAIMVKTMGLRLCPCTGCILCSVCQEQHTTVAQMVPSKWHPQLGQSTCYKAYHVLVEQLGIIDRSNRAC